MPATAGRVRRVSQLMMRLSIALALVALFVACEAASPPTSVARPDIVLAPDSRVSRGVVPRDSTLEAMLLEQGLQSDVVHGVIDAVRTVFDPRRLRSLQPFALEQSLDGALRLFEYEIDASSFLRVRSVLEDESRLRAEIVPIPVTVVPASVTGAIDDDSPSLFQSIEAAGEQPDLAIAMAQIFGGEIDFNTELQPGDRYTVAFERLEREGRRSSYGVISAAEFQNDGRVLRAIRFTPKGGQPGYYDPDGRSLRRFFLRSPLKFEPRVTSGFSARRMHPVLHTARAHRGVDYGAPMGSEVVSVASGRVLSVTSDATNGRMVRVRHASGYVSFYLHLSAFAAGIRAGAAIEQGQAIGRVGASGLATGPHLHYGLQKNGAFVNPLREHRNMPPGDPVPASELDGFRIERERAMAIFVAPGGSDSSSSGAADAQ
jgi:murein DD-endopeptidase MepM/ murein hydrolase activator NlpD